VVAELSQAEWEERQAHGRQALGVGRNIAYAPVRHCLRTCGRGFDTPVGDKPYRVVNEIHRWRTFRR